jgi:hypothetical protein
MHALCWKATRLRALIRSLKEGGLFITGANDEPGTVINGGIYKETKTACKGLRHRATDHRSMP